MSYCGDQTKKVEETHRFQKEREEKMKMASIDKILEVARQSKLRRNDKDLAEKQAREQENAAQVANSDEFISKLNARRPRQSKLVSEVDKEDKTRSIKGAKHAAGFLAGLVML